METQSLQDLIETARAAAAGPRSLLGARQALTFQWAWDIVGRGAEHLGRHQDAVSGLVTGGNAAALSPDAAAVAADPTNSEAARRLREDGLFGPALDAVRADQLLRTMFTGSSGGAQGGLFGGAGGSGTASDIIDPNQASAVSYSHVNIGFGAKVSGGFAVGAMAVQPAELTRSTCVWSSGFSLLAVSVAIDVLMNEADLGLLGFVLNIGAGVGLASSIGYGSISVT